MKPKDFFINDDLVNAANAFNDQLLKMESVQSMMEQAAFAQKMLENSGMQAWLRDAERFSDMAKQVQPFLEQTAFARTALQQTADVAFKQSAIDQFAAQENLLRSVTEANALGISKIIDFARDAGALAGNTLETFRSLQETFFDNRLFKIEKSFSELIDRYSDLYSISDTAIQLPEIPSELIIFPPVEMFNASRLVHGLRPTSEDEDDDDSQTKPLQLDQSDNFEVFLAQVNPDFVAPWKGAKQSLVSNNADRPRHTITSLRELFTHLLHHLAPDAEVKKWTNDPKYFYNNKPTRRARLDYICRSINIQPFGAFIDKDMKVQNEFIDLYQKGTHELVSKMGTTELKIFLIKTENFIRFLVEVWRLNRNN